MAATPVAGVKVNEAVYRYGARARPQSCRWSVNSPQPGVVTGNAGRVFCTGVQVQSGLQHIAHGQAGLRVVRSVMLDEMLCPDPCGAQERSRSPNARSVVCFPA